MNGGGATYVACSWLAKDSTNIAVRNRSGIGDAPGVARSTADGFTNDAPTQCWHPSAWPPSG